MITNAVASHGATAAMPPKSSIRRVWRLSYSIPNRRNSAPVVIPCEIITSSAPWMPFTVSAKIPITTNPM